MNNQELIGKRVRILPTAVGIAKRYINELAIVVADSLAEYHIIEAKVESDNAVVTLCGEGHLNCTTEFEIVMDKVIDKNNWCINMPRTEIIREVINFINKKHKYANFNGTGGYYGVRNGRADCNTKGWGTELTFQEFKQYILMQEDDNQDFEGYICPENLYDGQVKKGTIYKQRKGCSDSICYGPEGDCSNNWYAFPKEIVETWEKSWKKKEFIVKVAGNDVKVSKEGIFAEGAKIEERELLNIITLGGNTIYKWNIHLINATYKVGCWENVKLSEIKEVLAKYNEVKE